MANTCMSPCGENVSLWLGNASELWLRSFVVVCQHIWSSSKSNRSDAGKLRVISTLHSPQTSLLASAFIINILISSLLGSYIRLSNVEKMHFQASRFVTEMTCVYIYRLETGISYNGHHRSRTPAGVPLHLISWIFDVEVWTPAGLRLLNISAGGTYLVTLPANNTSDLTPRSTVVLHVFSLSKSQWYGIYFAGVPHLSLGPIHTCTHGCDKMIFLLFSLLVLLLQVFIFPHAPHW